MLQIKITAYQEVHYTKVVNLDQAEYDEFMALETEEEQQQWLADSDANFRDEDIDDYGNTEEFTVTPLT